MCLPILGSDPTLCQNCTDCIYNYYQVTTSLDLLLFIVYPRTSTTTTTTTTTTAAAATTRALLPVSNYVDVDKPDILGPAPKRKRSALLVYPSRRD